MTALDPGMAGFLQTVPLFSGLSESQIAGLLSESRLVHARRHDRLFERGARMDRLFTIVDGQFKLHRETRGGEEAILALPGRGDVIGGIAIFSESTHTFSGTATEDSWTLSIPVARVGALARATPDFLSNAMSHVTRKLQAARMETEHLMLMNAPQRVGCLLLQQWRRTMRRDSGFDLHGKGLIASRLGMKPETFSRALAQLETHGVRAGGGSIRIDNVVKLMDYCCEHCSAVRGECDMSGTEDFMH